MLCKSFVKLEPRPGQNLFRSIFFPEDEPLLRFVWVGYKNVDYFTSMSCEPFFGKNTLGGVIQDQPYLKRIPPHRLGIYYNDNYVGQGLPATPILTKRLGPAIGKYFRGPWLAHAYENGVMFDEEWESEMGRSCDIDTAGLASLLGYFEGQGADYYARSSFC